MTSAIWLSVTASVAMAACDFPTHAYRDELANPAQIEHISVEIKKSRKWFKNSISILASKKGNIEDRFKDKLSANVTARYRFGECTYPARIRQNGDWNDHIKLLPGGNLVSSLDVKLHEGNILNAVRFKLLLPITRGGINEVLGTLTLRELGYIAPETFLVSTDINRVPHVMLFQENAAKELLERNSRREGPIFEGDERVIWNVDGFDRFELEDISLARQTNGKWAQKGETSTQISLKAFEEIQAAYLAYTDNKKNIIDYYGTKLVPNPEINQHVFEDYAIFILAMNGTHALRPHNRKYYFNSFTQSFEPIYYDGDLNFLGSLKYSKKVITSEVTEYFLRYALPELVARMTDRINALRSNPSFKQAFLDRTISQGDDAEVLFNDGLASMLKNLRDLHSKMALKSEFIPPKREEDSKQVRQNLIERTKAHGFTTKYVEVEKRTESGSYLAWRIPKTGEVEPLELSPEELIQIISNNAYGDDRMVLLPRLDVEKNRKFRIAPFLNGEIVLSRGANVEVDHAERKMIVTQTAPNDWALIRGVSFSDWAISFEGSTQDISALSKQRFNEFGLTGCLNFYDVAFEDTVISGRNGQCEDIINIVASNGTLSALVVADGFADAIDIDFAKITINELKVTRAGNDCFDVSTGEFKIVTALLSDCGDKGLSIGENSTLKAGDVSITNAAIGISSKDFSLTKVARFIGIDIPVCAEALQKKQEFGGGKLWVDAYDCTGEVNSDAASDIVLNELIQ